MSGPMIHARYKGDDGTNYQVRLPDWEANFVNHAGTIGQNLTVATTEPPLPKGIRRRKRYYVLDSSGVEGSVTVLDPASTLWTAALGAPMEVPLFNAAVVTADNAKLRGRTGERTKLN